MRLKSKLSLPKLPDNIVEVHVPKGSKIRTGEINPLFGGKGGGVQFELMEKLKKDAYRNIKKHWQDGLATSLNVGVQAYRLIYSLAEVNDMIKKGATFEDGKVPTNFGALGQRLGLTDAAGDFSPRLTMRGGRASLQKRTSS